MSQRTFRPVAALACLGLLGAAASVRAAPIPVRFSEGVAHGFLTLRSEEGEPRAAGELVRVPQGELVESRLTFHFPDGSLYAETVVFSQHQVFTLQRYHLVQRGSAFRTTLEVAWDRATGQYRGRYADEKGAEQSLTGALEMPPDLYNGMTALLLQNLPRGASETVHMVAFTPTPRVIKLDLLPFADESVRVGEVSKSAIHYHVVPEFGGLLGFFTSLIGKKLPTLHYWITRERVPAFLGFEGPLELDGPVWRIGVSYRTEPPRLPQGK